MAGLRAQNLPWRQAYQACRIRRQAATWPASPATARTYPASTSADVLAGRHSDGRATNLLDPGLGAINRYRKRPASQARVRSGPHAQGQYQRVFNLGTGGRIALPPLRSEERRVGKE